MVRRTDGTRPILTAGTIFIQVNGASNAWVLRSTLDGLDAGLAIPLWTHTSSLRLSNVSSLTKIISINIGTGPLLTVVPRIIFHKLLLIFLGFPTLFLSRIRADFQLTRKDRRNMLLALIVVALDLGSVFKPTTR